MSEGKKTKSDGEYEDGSDRAIGKEEGRERESERGKRGPKGTRRRKNVGEGRTGRTETRLTERGVFEVRRPGDECVLGFPQSSFNAVSTALVNNVSSHL